MSEFIFYTITILLFAIACLLLVMHNALSEAKMLREINHELTQRLNESHRAIEAVRTKIPMIRERV